MCVILAFWISESKLWDQKDHFCTWIYVRLNWCLYPLCPSITSPDVSKTCVGIYVRVQSLLWLLWGNLLSPTGALYSQSHFLKHLVEHQDVTERGGAKMYVGRSREKGRSITGRPSSSENLGCKVVAGCCEMLQHRHGYHGSLITTPPGSGWPLLHNSMHLCSFQANVRVFYPNRAPGGGVSLVLLRSHWFQTVWQEPLWPRSGRSPDLYPLQYPPTISSAKNHGKGNHNSQHSHRRMNHSFAPFTQATRAASLGMHHGWDVSLQRCHYSTLTGSFRPELFRLMGFRMISITAEGIKAGRTERKSWSAVTEAGATRVTRRVNPVLFGCFTWIKPDESRFKRVSEALADLDVNIKYDIGGRFTLTASRIIATSVPQSSQHFCSHHQISRHFLLKCGAKNTKQRVLSSSVWATSQTPKLTSGKQY